MKPHKNTSWWDPLSPYTSQGAIQGVGIRAVRRVYDYSRIFKVKKNGNF